MGWKIGAVALLGLLGACLSVFPLVRWRIHTLHPEVQFDDWAFGWGSMRFSNVRVNHGWWRIEGATVRVNIGMGDVHVQGGRVFLDVDKRPSGQGSDGAGANVFGTDLTITVNKPGFGSAVLHDADVDASHVIASELELYATHYPRLVATHVEASRDFHHITLGAITFPEGLHFHDVSPTALSIEKASINIPERSSVIEHASFQAVIQETPVVVDARDLQVTLSGDRVTLKIDQVGVEHPWLSRHHVVFHDVETTLKDDFSEPLDIRVAGAHVIVNPKLLQIHGAESCQTWARALPEGLQDGPLATPDFKGDLSFTFGVKPVPTVKISSTCKSTCDAAPIQALRHRFTYTAYDKNGFPFDRTTGPDLKDDWTPLSDINEVMPLAVMNMEDLDFRLHHGFITSTIENSFVADVKSGKFARGGSTITMQLAKNVWLRRDKTIGRKAEELLLSQVLESCFSKDEILELYLNVVEFGPDLYGVGPAAKHYFQESPLELSGPESFYLAWLLPRPRKSPPPTPATMAVMGSLMRTLAKTGRIPDTMLLDVDSADTSGWEQ